MRGHFEVELKDSGTLRDKDFLSIPRYELSSFISSLQTVERFEYWNKCNDMIAGSLFEAIMSGPTVSSPYNSYNVGVGGLATINVEDRDPELTYTEWTQVYNNIHTPGYPVGTGDSGKRFIEDDVVDHAIEAYQNSREEVWFRSRWLYLPSEIVCGNIKSIGYFFAPDSDTTGNTSRATYGRFRLKDSNGVPITISKSSSQVLLVQMKLILVSV